MLLNLDAYEMKKRFAQRALLLIINILAVTGLRAQDLEHQAPSLQVGLSSFNFSKGTLDAALIMEIVAEKQGELKLKTIQNLFLNRVMHSGGTVYAFVDNCLKQIVDEKDQNIRSRKIFENTVNFVFVCTYLEYYLKDMNQEQYEQLRAFAGLFAHDLPALKPIPFSISAFYNDTKVKKSTGLDVKTESNATDNDLHFIPILIDLASEVVRNNANLKKLGVMEQSYTDSYTYLNEFLRLQREHPEQDTTVLAKAMYQQMSSKLTVLTDNIGYVSFLYDRFDFAINHQESLMDSLKFDSLFESLADRTSELIASLSNAQIDVTKDPNLAKEIKNLITFRDFLMKAQNYLSLHNKTDLANSKTISEILYALSKKYAGTLKAQAYRSKNYQLVLDELDQINESLLQRLDALPILEHDVKQNIGQDKFLSLIAKLYQFDKISSITEYLRLMEELIEILPNDNVIATLKTIVTFTKDYTVIEKDARGEEVLSFNAESFIMKLQQIKPYSLNRWEFLFTVGSNQTHFNRNIDITDSLTGVSNLAFVGEKIGLKFKIIDKAFSWNRNPGETFAVSTLRHPFKKQVYQRLKPPKEPIISNFHAILYGTGLLYNLVNTTTNKSFNLPMFGTGIGLTFYNGLDLNVSVGIPLLSNHPLSRSFDYPYINVGFDIQFAEYYSRLMKKRNDNQTQKRLAGARKGGD